MLRRVMATAIVVAAVAAGSTVVAGAGAAPGSVYLALGDSLAAGVQASAERHAGYEQLYQLEQARIPDLRLVNLGCPGATTGTMTIDTPRCDYAEGSQLEQAVEVVRRGHVAS